MRVYELAKKLGLENRELMPQLKRMGIAVTSHSSTLDSKAVAQALSKLAPQTKSSSAGDGGRVETSKRSALKKKDSSAGKGPASVAEAAVSRRSASRDTTRSMSSKSAPAVTEEPPKGDKKRVLIKRRKIDEELEPQAGVDAMPLADTLAQPASAPSPTATPSILPESQTPSPPPGTDSLVTAAQAASPGPSEPLAAEAAASATVSAAETDRDLRQAEKKKGVPEGPQIEEASGIRDKHKKVRKAGRTRSDEEGTFREDAARWQDLRAIPVHRREDRSRHHQPSAVTEITKPRKKVIKLPAGLTVKDFAGLVGQRPGDIVRKLMETGHLLTMNQPMVLDAALLIAEEYGLKVEVAADKQAEDLLEEAIESAEVERPEPRPPVVTIMGHVDHGKTSLLDAIRESRVTEEEAGGITQHIGAYTVAVHGRQVTFLDTPGHEAFTAMRSRGAKITDIVVLVVAADDGVMPQTVEAINHATAAGVPIIVAINKIDKPGSNPDRVKNSLSEHNLIPESWGGQTICVEVSAKQKLGLDTLLEMIQLQAEVLELKADPNRLAKGTVVEAKLDRGRGPVATVLVQSGTLRVGDAFVVGTFSGRVRALVTDMGAKAAEAAPSMPVEVIGLPGVPSAGDQFVAVNDERVAREIADSRLQKQRTAELAAGSGRVTLEDLYARIKEGDVKELALVIKADVQGSAEAVSEAVQKLSTAAVRLRVIHTGVGGITESDVLLASAARAIVIGFNIRPETKAAALAEREGIDIRLYTVIYDALADIKAAMEGLLQPTLKERFLGRAEVRMIFTLPKAGVIAGSYVLDGTISRSSAGLRVVRDSVPVHEGKIGSLRRFKDDVREVQQGYECGIGVENYSDLKPGDVIEVYALDKVAAKL
ncbi:MAG: translation initiation factor IF-2 [Nitrospiraceae bacterium]